MSYDLGHSRGYINNITSGKSLPSLTELFAICDYFEITLPEFFGGASNPKLIKDVNSGLEQLNEKDLSIAFSKSVSVVIMAHTSKVKRKSTAKNQPCFQAKNGS